MCWSCPTPPINSQLFTGSFLVNNQHIATNTTYIQDSFRESAIFVHLWLPSPNRLTLKAARPDEKNMFSSLRFGGVYVGWGYGGILLRNQGRDHQGSLLAPKHVLPSFCWIGSKRRTTFRCGREKAKQHMILLFPMEAERTRRNPTAWNTTFQQSETSHG